MTSGRWRAARGPRRSAFWAAASRALHGERGIRCPSCGKADLRAYYHAFERNDRWGAGTIWVWCPACGVTGQLSGVTPLPTVDLGVDPLADLTREQFRALEADRDLPFMDRLEQLWQAGTLRPGGERRERREPVRSRWSAALSAPYQFPYMGAASRLLRGERGVRCPKCQEVELRAYFHVFDEERQTGTIWVWCPACRLFSHLPRVKPTGDLGPDPFDESALNESTERLLDTFERLWLAGKLGTGKQGSDTATK